MRTARETHLFWQPGEQYTATKHLQELHQDKRRQEKARPTHLNFAPGRPQPL